VTADDVAGFPAVVAVQCDLHNLAETKAALTGADVVICCYRETPDQDARAAVRNLIAAAKAANIERLIYLSSVAVYGCRTGYVTEDCTGEGQFDWYARAKHEAESALAECASSSLSVVVLRPSLIYGPRGREWSSEFVWSIARGHLIGLGSAADGNANLVHVEDLAAFCVKLVTRAIPRHIVLNVNGPAAITFRDYFWELRAAILDQNVHVPAPRRFAVAGKVRRLLRGAVKVPRKLLGARVHGLKSLDRALERAGAALRPRPQDFSRHFFSAKTYYSAERASELGFTSARSLAEGTRDTVTWMRSSGLL
jgi:UDP-glucose 4-epimerase